MELIEPSSAYIDSYKLALIEFDLHGISGFWKGFDSIDDVGTYLQNIKQYQHRSGLDHSVVTASVFWLVDGDEFIGHVSVRHSLTAGIRRKGGHVGYAIRPMKHRQGYGSRILELALPRVRSLGIQQALVTCDRDNIASRKIIEMHGGILFDEIEVNGRPILRFWIRL